MQGASEEACERAAMLSKMAGLGEDQHNSGGGIRFRGLRTKSTFVNVKPGGPSQGVSREAPLGKVECPELSPGPEGGGHAAFRCSTREREGGRLAGKPRCSRASEPPAVPRGGQRVLSEALPAAEGLVSGTP